MAIGALVEALLLVVVGPMAQKVSLHLKMERFERMDQKQTHSLDKLPGRLGVKAAEGLPGIIGEILS